MAYRSTKTYGHNLGLSCAFRQWRAESHCRLIHGYAMSVRLEFGANQLDQRNWVMDFGALKPIKQYLTDTFDHVMLVAQDDPHLDRFVELDKHGLANVQVVENVGCEAFAEMVFHEVDQWLKVTNHAPRVFLVSVEVREHGANSAIYQAGS